MVTNKTPWLFIVGLLILLLTLSNFVVSLQNPSTDSLEDYLDKRLKELQLTQSRQGEPGYTPQKGVDYFDGKNGVNGVDGRDGQQGIQGEQGQQGVQGVKGEKGEPGESGAQGQDGQDGKTPELRCNPTGRYWQVRYSEEENWKELGGEQTPC